MPRLVVRWWRREQLPGLGVLLAMGTSSESFLVLFLRGLGLSTPSYTFTIWGYVLSFCPLELLVPLASLSCLLCSWVNFVHKTTVSSRRVNPHFASCLTSALILGGLFSSCLLLIPFLKSPFLWAFSPQLYAQVPAVDLFSRFLLAHLFASLAVSSASLPSRLFVPSPRKKSPRGAP